MKSLFAFLLLCSSLCAADPSTGPMLGIWPVTGFGLTWQTVQQSNGLPLEPTITLPNPDELYKVEGSFINTTPEGHNTIDALAPLLSKFNNKSLVFRMDNIRTELTRPRYRLATLTEDNWRQERCCVIRRADGSLKVAASLSGGVACPFSTTSWEPVGKDWAVSPWMVKFQQTVTPSGVILRENNEGNNVEFKQLYVSDRVYFINNAGTLRPLEEPWTTDVTAYCDPSGNKLPADAVMQQVSQGTYVFRYWKGKAALDLIDLRADEWVSPRRGTDPVNSASDFSALWRNHYAEFYRGLNDNLTPAYQPLRFCSYNPSWGPTDSISWQTYTGYYDAHPPSITSPVYAQEITARRSQWNLDLANPRSWREISVRMSGATTFASFQDGTGDIVDADSWAGFCAHYAWAMQAPGREVRQVLYEDYQVLATRGVIENNPDWVAAVTAAGRPELAALRLGQKMADADPTPLYTVVLTRLAEIHNHSTLRKYWQQGTTEVLPSSANDGHATLVYATLTTLPDSPRKLLAVYTPCTQSQLPTIHAGDYEVPWARWSYSLTDPLEPLPPDVPVPTCEEQLAALQAKLDSLQTQIDLLTASNQTLTAKVVSLIAERNAAQAQVATLTQQVADLQARIAKGIESLQGTN